MLKWIGFYLSDQTAAINKDVTERSKVNNQKTLMQSEEIEKVLNEARLKSKPVSVQLEALNENAQYYDDVIGMIRGYDELGIYIGDQKVHYDEIRNVEVYNWKKWSELK